MFPTLYPNIANDLNYLENVVNECRQRREIEKHQKISDFNNMSDKIIHNASVKLKSKKDQYETKFATHYDISPPVTLNLGKVDDYLYPKYRNGHEYAHLRELEVKVNSKVPDGMMFEFQTKIKEECVTSHVGFLGYDPFPRCKTFNELFATVKW